MIKKKRGEKNKKGENAFNDYPRDYVKRHYYTRTVLKGPCARHGHSPAGAGEGEPRPTPQSSGCQARSCRHRQAHVAWQCQEQSTVPRGTHSCIPSCPALTRSYTHASARGAARLCHPARSQQSCSSPGAGHTASLAIPVLLGEALQSYQTP